MSKKVASLFDHSGTMLKPWLEAGYECHIFDIKHPAGINTREDGMITHGVDLSVCPEAGEYEFISCFPPCTHLAISGAAWFKGKGLRALEESIAFFATCIEFVEGMENYIIENPMSTISTYWRSPDHKFHPCHYSGYVDNAENYTKETWLWVGDDFRMPPRRMHDLFEEPDKTYIHHQPPGPDRAEIRSKTPDGFARAVFAGNAIMESSND